MAGLRREAQRTLALFLTISILLGVPAAIRGGDPVSTGAVREALREGGYPWYDARRDDVVRGKSLWRDGMLPRKPRPSRRDMGSQDGEGRSDAIESPGSDRETASSVSLSEVLVSAFIALGVACLAYVVFLAWRGRRSPDADSEASGIGPRGEAADALPDGLRAAGGDPLKALRAAYKAGRLGEAMMYLFTHQLLSLDRHGHIVLERGKTNRRYLRELPRAGTLRRLMEDSLRLFEDSFFGGREPSRDEFDARWREWRGIEPKLGHGRPERAVASSTVTVLLVGVLLVALGGCRSGDDSAYGLVSGKSFNGTGVFARVLESDGHEVEVLQTWHLLVRPDDQVAVYFQPDHAPPSDHTLDLLDSWSSELSSERRTLLYVVRDYEARIDFLRGVLEWAEGRLATMAAERLSAIELSEQQLRWEVPLLSTPWFRYEKASRLTRCDAIWTSPSWDQEIQADLVSLVYSGRLDRFDDADRSGSFSTLIECTAGPLVVERYIADSAEGVANRNRVIVVANGSFLVNYALVNKEHRALALALSRELGRDQSIAFIEDPPARPVYASERDEEDAPNVPTGLSLLTVWPLNGLLAQLLLVGVLYALYRFPILGRPRSPRQQVPGFSRHVEALGSLLEDTGDRALAREIVRRCRAQLSASAAPRVDGIRRRVKSSGVKRETS